MADPNRVPRLPPVDDEDARIAISAMTAEQREGIFRFARTVLPEGHPLMCRIDALVERMGLRLGHMADAALDAEINETAIEVFGEIESLKAAAWEESTRMIEEYRRARLARMEQFVPLASIAEHEWDDLIRAFADAHEHNPDLCAWVFMNEVPMPTGPGSLLFRELADQAAWVLARDRGESAWKDWIDLVLGYLLKNDLDEEYIRKLPAGHRDRPEGSTPETHPGVVVEGENYEIRHFFKASEHCCSWLKRRWSKEMSPPAASRDSADTTPRSHQGPLLPSTEATANVPDRDAALPAPGRQRAGCSVQKWEDMEIRFLSEERVQIFIGGRPGATKNFAEMGFDDRRGKGGKPRRAWLFLEMLSKSDGIFPARAISGQQGVQKRAGELRHALSNHFQIAADPLPFVEGIGYKLAFKISRSPACDS